MEASSNKYPPNQIDEIRRTYIKWVFQFLATTERYFSATKNNQ